MRRPREALISARVERGLSATEAAAELHVQVRTLLNAEDGEPVLMATARKFATYYGRSVAELFPDWAEHGGRWVRNGNGR